MHSPETRHEFLKLRAAGQSLTSIGRQLGISKPTLIKWNRELQPELSASINELHQSILREVAANADSETAALQRRITAVKQELFSRAIHDLPTPTLETMLGSLQDRLRSLPDPAIDNGKPDPGQSTIH